MKNSQQRQSWHERRRYYWVCLVKGFGSTCLLAGLAVGDGNRSERWVSKEQRNKEHCDEAGECFRARPLTQFVRISVEIGWYQTCRREVERCYDLIFEYIWRMLFSSDISVILLPLETVGLCGTDQARRHSSCSGTRTTTTVTKMVDGRGTVPWPANRCCAYTVHFNSYSSRPVETRQAP